MSASVNVCIQNASFVKPCKIGIWCECGLVSWWDREGTRLADSGVTRSFFWSWHDSRQEALLSRPKYLSFLLIRCNLLHLEPIWFKMATPLAQLGYTCKIPSSKEGHILRLKVGMDITNMCLVFGFFGLTHRSEMGKRLATHTSNAKCQRTVTNMRKGGSSYTDRCTTSYKDISQRNNIDISWTFLYLEWEANKSLHPVFHIEGSAKTC